MANEILDKTKDLNEAPTNEKEEGIEEEFEEPNLTTEENDSVQDENAETEDIEEEVPFVDKTEEVETSSEDVLKEKTLSEDISKEETLSEDKIEEEIPSEDKEETSSEDKKSFAELYYDEFDRKHADILSKLSVPCYSHKDGFTNTERLDVISDILKDSPFEEVRTKGVSMWLKKGLEVDLTKPFILVTSHADLVPNIDKPFSTLDDDGMYLGTYDNIATNAASVIAMLEGDFTPNVAFAFTSEEETGEFTGVKEALSILNSMGVDNITAIALDVTDDGYDEKMLFQVENPHPNKIVNNIKAFASLNPDSNTQAFRIAYSGPDKSIEKLIKKTLKKHFKNVVRNSLDIPVKKKKLKKLSKKKKKQYVSSERSWPDEGYYYRDEADVTTSFSLCLPCDGEMHCNAGIRVAQPAFEGYCNALQCIIYKLTNTHESIIEAKKIEQKTLLERMQDVKYKKAPIPTYFSSSSNRSSGNSFIDYDYDYDYDDGYDYYGESLDEILENEMLQCCDAYSYYQDHKSEKKLFVEDMVNILTPYIEKKASLWFDAQAQTMQMYNQDLSENQQIQFKEYEVEEDTKTDGAEDTMNYKEDLSVEFE